ncbi:MAG: YfhO family protein, partial [Candidatus Levybacteria bacterium]|nr:YfhO family protein [Candidatus Levybacteria bacterium]
EILVLADQFDEGWKATIDNKDSKISPANLIFRAVKIPAGKHEVIFSYYPSSFDLGLKISSISIILLILGSFVAVKTKRF